MSNYPDNFTSLPSEGMTVHASNAGETVSAYNDMLKEIRKVVDRFKFDYCTDSIMQATDAALYEHLEIENHEMRAAGH